MPFRSLQPLNQQPTDDGFVPPNGGAIQRSPMPFQAPQQQPNPPSKSMWSITQNPIVDALASFGKGLGNLGVGAAKGVIDIPREFAATGAAVGGYLGKKTGEGIRTIMGKPPLPENAPPSGAELAMKKGLEQTALTKPVGTAQKVGYGVEKAAEFLVPGAQEEAGAELAGKVASKLPGAKSVPFITEKLAPFIGKSLQSAADVGTRTALQTGGNVEEAKKGAEVGAFIPGGTALIGGLGKVAGKVVETIASRLSGVPTDAIKYAIENPQGVRGAIRAMAKDPEMGAQKILSNAEEALSNLQEARSTAYQNNLARVEQETMTTKNGQLYVKRVVTPEDVRAGMASPKALGQESFIPTNLTTKGLKDTITKTIKDFGGSAKGAEIDLSKVALPNSYKSQLQEVIDKVYTWDDVSPTGLNKLRQNIDVFKKAGIDSAEKQFNKIIGDMRTNISKYVGDRVPQIQSMNEEYAAHSDVIDTIMNELKLGKEGRVSPMTPLRKLINVFNPKSVVYKKLVEQLGEQGGKDLLHDVAGLLMSKWTPEGLGSFLTPLMAGGTITKAFTNPAALLALPAEVGMSSPRVVGEAATALGDVAKAIPEGAGQAVETATRGVTAATEGAPKDKKGFRKLKPIANQ